MGVFRLRVPVWMIVLSILDCVVFITVWLWRAMGAALQHAVPTGLTPAYYIFGYLGLVLGIFGFIALGRLLHEAISDGLQRAILCVLFAMVPGCAAVVSLLSIVGGQPV